MKIKAFALENNDGVIVEEHGLLDDALAAHRYFHEVEHLWCNIRAIGEDGNLHEYEYDDDWNPVIVQ